MVRTRGTEGDAFLRVPWFNGTLMAEIRYVPDKDAPSVAIEIPLDKPLPDYDLDEVEQPTPRDVDGILVSQGFRDLVDDARGILTDLIAAPPNEHHKDETVLEIDMAP